VPSAGEQNYAAVVASEAAAADGEKLVHAHKGVKKEAPQTKGPEAAL